MALPGPEAVAHAASTLVTTALHLREGDRFVVICDADSSALADVVRARAEVLGVQVTLARLDQLRSVSTNHPGDRPHKVLPDLVRRAMLAAQGSVFLASAPHQELSMREQLQHIVGACKVRHAHMPGLSEKAFALGLQTDCAKLETWGRAVERRLELAQVLEATSPAGTDVSLRFASSNRWTPHLGSIAPGHMSNRVGLAIVGVNLELAATGEAAVDENLPGLHLMIGDAAGRVRTTAWSARTSFTACQASATVSTGGDLVLDDGKLVTSP